MIIDQKTKRKFALHVSRDEMRNLELALQDYGAKWSCEKSWEAANQIGRILDASRITIEEMAAEEAELFRITIEKMAAEEAELLARKGEQK